MKWVFRNEMQNWAICSYTRVMQIFIIVISFCIMCLGKVIVFSFDEYESNRTVNCILQQKWAWILICCYVVRLFIHLNCNQSAQRTKWKRIECCFRNRHSDLSLLFLYYYYIFSLLTLNIEELNVQIYLFTGKYSCKDLL